MRLGSTDGCFRQASADTGRELAVESPASPPYLVVSSRFLDLGWAEVLALRTWEQTEETSCRWPARTLGCTLRQQRWHSPRRNCFPISAQKKVAGRCAG